MQENATIHKQQTESSSSVKTKTSNESVIKKECSKAPPDDIYGGYSSCITTKGFPLLWQYHKKGPIAGVVSLTSLKDESHRRAHFDDLEAGTYG